MSFCIALAGTCCILHEHFFCWALIPWRMWRLLILALWYEGYNERINQ